MKLVRLFSFIVLCLISCNFSYAEQGNVIHSFQKGKMQCLSEIDSSGEIKVLLKSLEKNTKVLFTRISYTAAKKPIVVVSMQVEDKEICASWVDIQEVQLAIDPQTVNEFTLNGKVVYNKNHITVMTE